MSSLSSLASRSRSRRDERRCRAVTVFMRKNLLLTLTIVAVVLGVFLGFVLRSFDLTQDTIQLINFPGEIFMQVLKLMILPLIFSSLISALAQMDAKESGQMGAITILYYMTTTVLSTITGIVMVLAIHPGDPTIKNDFSVNNSDDSNISPLDTFLDLVRNMFPENIVQATFERVQTSYVMVKPSYQKKTFNGTIVVPPLLRKSIISAEGMNILGIIVFCTGFGIVISKLGEKARIVVEFFVILDAVIMKFVETVMW
uniref:Amino acid transporter n=1 Tax=Steinernema glaseri TaxID=37863 RepID=A0A1I7YKZ2_9BILA